MFTAITNNHKTLLISGKNYDKDGNFIQWWDNKTLSRFDERTQCYVDQYSLYTVTPNRHVGSGYSLYRVTPNRHVGGGYGLHTVTPNRHVGSGYGLHTVTPNRHVGSGYGLHSHTKQTCR